MLQLLEFNNYVHFITKDLNVLSKYIKMRNNLYGSNKNIEIRVLGII